MKKFSCQFFGVFPIMKEYTRAHLKDFHLSISEHELASADELKTDSDILGVFVGSKVDAVVFDKLPHLKLIVTMSTGYDHIDLALAKKRRIPVCNVPTYGENTVAEHAVALILALSRQLFTSVKRVKEGSFNYDGLRGFDLKGKTVGVVGTGHIGAQVIRILKGFEMDILACDAFPNKTMEKSLGFTYVSLPKLLATADIITLHVPLLKETTHIINKKNIKKTKPGAYIINTARGGLIDTEALLWGIESGHIAGAGLDVLEDENFIQNPEKLLARNVKPKDVRIALMDNILIDHPKVIITPHNAFNSAEALQRIMDVTIDNVKVWALGKVQNNVAN